MSALTNNWDSIRAWWQTATPATRAAATAAVLLLVIGLIVAARLASSPDYTPIYRGVSGKEADAIKTILTEKSIPMDFSTTDGTISVPSKDEGDATMYVEAAGILSKDAQVVGIESLDKLGMGTSSAVENVKINAANEGEMERKLMTLAAVQSASVSISPASDSSLFGSATTASASVILDLRTGETLDADHVKGIVSLITGAVPGLDPKNVALTDQTGAPLWQNDSVGSGLSGSDPSRSESDKYAASVRDQLQSSLDSILGPNKVRVLVSAELDFDQSQVHSVEHTPTPGDTTSVPVSVDEENESYSGAGGASHAGGVAGASGNLNAPSYSAAGAGGGSDGKYKRTKTVTNYTDNTEDTMTQKAPGSIQALSVAALVDTSIPAGELPVIQQTLSTYIHALPGNNARLVSVQQIPFDTSGAKMVQDQLKAAQTQQLMATIARAVAAVAVAGVLLFLLTRAGRQSDAPQLTHTGEGAHIGLLERGFDASGAGETELEERPLRIEDVLAEMPEVIARRPRRMQAQAIEEQQDLKLESVQEMVNVNPAAVALLLKGWMASEARVN